MKKIIISILIFVLLQSSAIFAWAFLDPKFFVEGFPISSWGIYVPIMSLVFTIIFMIVMRNRSFTTLLILVPIFSFYMFGTVEPYFINLDHRKTDYEFYLNTKRSGEPSSYYFVSTSKSNYFDQNLEKKLIKKINDDIPENFVVSRVQTDSEEPIVWIEVLKPSFLMGSLSEFAYFDIETNRLSNFVTEQQVSKALKKYGVNVYHFDRKETIISNVFINDIKGEVNILKIIKSDGKLILN
ncbi:hypothetical protein [Paenibacillus sp. GCM10012306]|uniref:hypothetical protein n=1 Tax=Paenibacillus sp. GCM10012306 TaxID=3317342 RepID=UPI00362400EF